MIETIEKTIEHNEDSTIITRKYRITSKNSNGEEKESICTAINYYPVDWFIESSDKTKEKK